ncbi:MAG: minor capsid protein [Butyricicoccus sp.]
MIYYSLNLKVPKNVLEKRVVKANKWLCEEIIKDTDQFVPARTGALAMNVHRQGNTIVYASPYARFQYYGKVMIEPATGSCTQGHTQGIDRSKPQIQQGNAQECVLTGSRQAAR